MKRYVFFIALLSLIFVSCDKKNDVKTFKFDGDAKIHIKESKGLRSDETAQPMTWAEIVRTPLVAITWVDRQGRTMADGLYFQESERDLQKNELLLPGYLLVAMNSDKKVYIEEDWAMCTDFCIYVLSEDFKHRDTVAYIPNADRTAFMNEVKRLFKEGNSDAIYSLFKENFKAKRCTGKEWRELKAQGLN